jgi:hypothetical protein
MRLVRPLIFVLPVAEGDDTCPATPPAERAPYPSSVRAVSRPLASAASTVPISLPR